MAVSSEPCALPAVWNEKHLHPGDDGSDFYTQLLGWTTTDVDMGPMGSYTMFQQTSPNVGGIVRLKGSQWEGLPPHWSVYVQVDNVDARARKAEELGGTVAVPPFDIPQVGRACIITDPEGASFYMFTPKGASSF
ncbi:MAG: VOC family protein [Planctomycetes bacterium]|nr:VOC family protein [Planctomycetota bacterium]